MNLIIHRGTHESC